MEKVIITTVGTSLFDNYHKETQRKNRFNGLGKVEHSYWEDYKEEIDDLREKVLIWIEKNRRSNNKASAEIESSLKIVEEIQEPSDEIKVIFLATDTILSRLAAEIVRGILRKMGNIIVIFNPDKDVISGLQLEDKERFEEEGLMNLAERVSGICGIYTADDNKAKVKAEVKGKVYLNITGGYKALIPYLTIIGQIYKLPIYYKFEESKNIITIPQAPVEYDFLIVDENYMLFEILERGKDGNLLGIEELKKVISKDEEKVQRKLEELVNAGLIQKNEIEANKNKFKLAPLGRMLFKRHARFAEQGVQRSNLLGALMEMRIYQYFVGKYLIEGNGGNKVIQGYAVPNSKNVNDKYDVDIFIELSSGSKIAVEVKSGNPPILKQEPLEKKDKSLEKKIIEGAFWELAQKEKDIEFRVYCYSFEELAPIYIDNMQKLHEKYPVETKNLSWYWVKLGTQEKNGGRTMDFNEKIENQNEPAKIYPTS